MLRRQILTSLVNHTLQGLLRGMTAREETETKRGTGEKEVILLHEDPLQNIEIDLATNLEVILVLRLHIMADRDVNPIHVRGLEEMTMREETKEEEMYMTRKETGIEEEKGHIPLEGRLHLLGHTVSLISLHYPINLSFRLILCSFVSSSTGRAFFL